MDILIEKILPAMTQIWQLINDNQLQEPATLALGGAAVALSIAVWLLFAIVYGIRIAGLRKIIREEIQTRLEHGEKANRLQENLQALQTDHAHQTEQLAGIRQEKLDASEKATRLEQQIERVIAQLSEGVQRLSNTTGMALTQTHLDDTGWLCQTYDELCASILAQLSTEKNKSVELTVKIEQLDQLNSQSQEAIKQLQQALNTQIEQNQQLATQIANGQDNVRISALEEQLTAATSELALLQQRIKDSEAQLHLAREQLKQMPVVNPQATAQDNAQLSALMTQLQEKDALIAQLQSQVADNANQVHSQERDKPTQKHEEAKVQSQTDQTTSIESDSVDSALLATHNSVTGIAEQEWQQLSEKIKALVQQFQKLYTDLVGSLKK